MPQLSSCFCSWQSFAVVGLSGDKNHIGRGGADDIEGRSIIVSRARRVAQAQQAVAQGALVRRVGVDHQYHCSR